MPAFQLEPDGNGSYAAWAFQGGASALACVQDDNDANYIYIGGGTGDCRHNLTLGSLPGDAVGVTPPVTHHGRWRRVSGGTGVNYASFRYSTTDSDQSVSLTADSNWYNLTSDFADAPGQTGWTVAQLNATEIGVRGSAVGFSLCQNRLYATGNYYLAGACFIPILSLVLGLIGAGLSAADMRALARFIFEHRRMPGGARVLIRPDEYRRALDSWRACRFPRFAFLAPAAR